MSVLRGRLSWLAAFTLTFQLGVIASATTALCCGPVDAAAAEDEMPCCRDGGPGHVCPIKKAPAPGAPSIKSCCDVDQQALAALFGFVGTAESSYSLLALDSGSARTAGLIEQPIALVLPPPSPPPRA